MISKITLNQVASYTDEVEILPSKINYIYGGNGSGKTTISNVIANESFSLTSSVVWNVPTALDTLVYNKKFVDENFGQSKTIKGIFTLGKDSVDTHNSIEKTKAEIDNIEKNILALNKNIDKNKAEYDQKEIQIIERYWSVKDKYKDHFTPAFKGFLGTKKSFRDKCVIEKDCDKSNVLNIEELITKCNAVFNSDLVIQKTIDAFEYNGLTDIETSPILTEKIIGKEDIPIGRLIKSLGNSDWVKNGIDHMHSSIELCPFCQQNMENSLREQIEDFFDESYTKKCNELLNFKKRYQDYIDLKIEELRNIIRKDISIIDNSQLVIQAKLLQGVVKSNIAEIDKKIESPSIPISIESLSQIFQDIYNIVDSYISSVNKNNLIVQNIEIEKDNLKKYIWVFISKELYKDISSYLNETDKLINANLGMELKIRQLEIDLNSARTKLVGLESEITNITRTINEINRILKLFSFTNFHLSEADESGFYKIIRGDGTEAHETLSEGEHRFITFLYFYHLIQGSTNDSGITRDKVVVLDDPISSLDSSVLFVVSNLIKNLILDCKKGIHGIKQVFVLTHNVYFFKEVTFKGARKDSKWLEESFWVVKKINNKSAISKHDTNPIKTSYELLWNEISDNSKVSNISVFNAMRRILEYYFNIIGGMDYEACICQFEGEEQLICKSLLSWINDGSHSIGDDLVFHVQSEEIERYLNVFRLVFDKMNHIEHYNMMMRSN